MRILAFIILLVSVMSVGAVEIDKEPLPHDTLRFKDGSYLHIHDDDTTVMVDKNGNPIKMIDGIEMELEDGTRVMMKNNKVWRQIRRKVLISR
jgi:copper resistance protein K